MLHWLLIPFSFMADSLTMRTSDNCVTTALVRGEEDNSGDNTETATWPFGVSRVIWLRTSYRHCSPPKTLPSEVILDGMTIGCSLSPSRRTVAGSLDTSVALCKVELIARTQT
jgi:hypothetical protein